MSKHETLLERMRSDRKAILVELLDSLGEIRFMAGEPVVRTIGRVSLVLAATHQPDDTLDYTGVIEGGDVQAAASMMVYLQDLATNRVWETKTGLGGAFQFTAERNHQYQIFFNSEPIQSYAVSRLTSVITEHDTSSKVAGQSRSFVCDFVIGAATNQPSAKLVDKDSLEVYCPLELDSLPYRLLVITIQDRKGELVSQWLEPAFSGVSGSGEAGIVASVRLTEDQASAFENKQLVPRIDYDLDAYIAKSNRDQVSQMHSRAVQLRSRRVMNDPATKAKVDSFIEVLEKRLVALKPRS